MNSVLHSLLFYVFAIIVLGSAVFTAFSPNLVHAAFSLLFTFFGLACMYILAGADFVGISNYHLCWWNSGASPVRSDVHRTPGGWQ